MRRALIALMLALPLIGAAAGHFAAPGLARIHGDVQLARLLDIDVTPNMKRPSDQLRAFRLSGETEESVRERAAAVRRRFAVGGVLFGLWVGLVVALKMSAVTRPSRQTEYEVDGGVCLSCGRCYKYCPRERHRWKGEGEEGEPAQA